VTEDDIAASAEAVSAAHFPTGSIEPIELIERLGITWTFGNYRDAFDGLIEYVDGEFHIYLNQDRLGSLEAPRTRFTASHELGHYFLDEHRNALIATQQPHPSFVEIYSNNVIEQQADLFASHFLLPRPRFLKKARNRMVTCATVLELARVFRCSVMSTAITFAREHSDAVITMLWGDTQRKWCWSSEMAFHLTGNKAHKAATKIPLGSLTSEVREGSGYIDPKELRGSLLSSWFPFIQEGSPKDKICKESAVRLGGFGVLTLLDVEL
jgi:Zn-dependent peptidase ImmA (M78 family)